MKLYNEWKCLVSEYEYWDGFIEPGADCTPHWTERVLGLWLHNRLYAAWEIVRYRSAKVWCDRFGHPQHMIDTDDFVAAERDTLGRIIDIDGGGVDWCCRLCGRGGRSWF